MSRRCLTCQLPEERRTDSFGRVSTNLDPTTQLCVACLIGLAKQQVRAMPSEPADYKIRQAGDEP